MELGGFLVRVLEHLDQHSVNIVLILVFELVLGLNPEIVLDPFGQFLEVGVGVDLSLSLVQRVDEGILLHKAVHLGVEWFE